MTDTKTVDLDWNNLGFEYMDLPYRYRAYWKDGEWHKAGLVEDSSITINEGSPIVHYGQGCFEGMKAYRCKDGSVNLFRPDQFYLSDFPRKMRLECNAAVSVF